MENQMETNIKDRMEAGVFVVLRGVVLERYSHSPNSPLKPLNFPRS